VGADLPGAIRVKLSTEDAGAVSITPVVSQEMPLRALIELMLDITGKDAARVQDLLARGTFVGGATRYRWQGWQAGVESLQAVLNSLPDPDPTRPFTPQRCEQVLFRGTGFKAQISQQAIARRTLFSRSSFWDALAQLAALGELEYAGYSYRERRDRYRLTLSVQQREQLQQSARLIQYTELRAQIRSGSLKTIEFLVRRDYAKDN
jgi:DNA-binding CsgD family transcriptional regulator